MINLLPSINRFMNKIPVLVTLYVILLLEYIYAFVSQGSPFAFVMVMVWSWMLYLVLKTRLKSNP